MFRSAPYLLEFHRRVSSEAAKLTGDYEILFVNDGSPDESLAIALSLREADPHVKVVDLSRNFGHHKAMMTGLRHARGKRVFLIDCDLEEEPELLGRFDAVLAANPQADVVYGVQSARKGAWFERITGKPTAKPAAVSDKRRNTTRRLIPEVSYPLINSTSSRLFKASSSALRSNSVNMAS